MWQLVVFSQVILINFQASFLASTLFAYLRDAIISTKLFPAVVVIIVIVIVTFIGNTLSRRTSLIDQRLALLDFQGTHFAQLGLLINGSSLSLMLTTDTCSLFVYAITSNLNLTGFYLYLARSYIKFGVKIAGKYGYRNAILDIEMPFWISKCHSGYRNAILVIEMPFWLSKCHSGYRFGYRNAILVIEMPFWLSVWLSKCHSGYRSGYRNAIMVIGPDYQNKIFRNTYHYK